MSRQSLIFKDLNSEDKTVMVVTHDSHVASYAVRIVRIEYERVGESCGMM